MSACEEQAEPVEVSDVEDERRRLAGELHDQTLQGLAAIRIELTLALEAEDEKRREMIERAIKGLEAEVTALRALIAELRDGKIR